jgi:hypothetical protein
MTMKHLPTTKPVVVFGPDIEGHGGEFHVHAPGCADITRGRLRFRYHEARSMAFDALSEQDVIEQVCADQIAEYGEGWQRYAGDFTFFPCSKLPATHSREDARKRLAAQFTHPEWVALLSADLNLAGENIHENKPTAEDWRSLEDRGYLRTRRRPRVGDPPSVGPPCWKELTEEGHEIVDKIGSSPAGQQARARCLSRPTATSSRTTGPIPRRRAPGPTGSRAAETQVGSCSAGTSRPTDTSDKSARFARLLRPRGSVSGRSSELGRAREVCVRRRPQN